MRDPCHHDPGGTQERFSDAALRSQVKSRPEGGKPLKPDRDITDPRLAKALAHPLRVRILGVLDEGVASPSQIAGALGAPLGVVAYHVRRLAALGFVELVSQSERRGAVEHHYRATDRPVVTNEAWADVPAVAKAAMVSATLAGVGDHVAAAAGTGGFDRSDAHLTRSPMVLDEEGWREVAARLDGLLQDLEGIASEAERRLAEDDHQGEIRATAVLMLFEEALPHAVPERAPAPSRRRAVADHASPH
jgi:DNA-binding transcriptional ArsR family regulator